MAANFDLPMSKDMHMTDEYFDEVNLHVLFYNMPIEGYGIGLRIEL